MDPLSLKNHCRICFSIEEELSKINSTYISCENNTIAILEILNSFSDIKVGGDYPDTICSHCVLKAVGAYEFKLQCDRSNQICQGLMDEIHPEVISDEVVKEETFILDIKSDEDDEEESNADGNGDNLKNVNKKVHLCIECNKTFKTKDTWRVHVKRHETAGQFACHICGKRFSSAPYLHKHITFHTSIDDRKFECEICHKKFALRSILNLHHRRVHSKLKKFVCSICGGSFSYSKSFKNHMRTHTKEKAYQCEICGKSVSNLYRHRKSHTGEKPHKCKECGKAFVTKAALRVHEVSHSGLKPYSCELCEKKFTQKKNLNEHILSHKGEKPHLCPVCGNRYLKKQALKVHVNRYHTGQAGPYACKFCDQTFVRKLHLQQHERTHTGNKRHICEICQKGFTVKKNLKNHIMLHTGEKPFVCPECGKGFIKKDKFKLHLEKSHETINDCSTEENENGK